LPELSERASPVGVLEGRPIVFRRRPAPSAAAWRSPNDRDLIVTGIPIIITEVAEAGGFLCLLPLGVETYRHHDAQLPTAVELRKFTGSVA
jgi:hypothetical protein